MAEISFPRTGRPALDALANAGYTHLSELDGVSMREVLALHGMGPKGIGALRRAMAEHGWAFADDDPTVGAVQGGPSTTRKATGRNDNQTEPTAVDPAEWVESLPKPRQVEQGRAMLRLFGEVTGEPARMWGPSMVGYGHQHYVYDSGREGDAMRLGFSPRSANLVLYVLGSEPEPLLERLGPHKRGVSCLYLTNLDKLDLDVLREIVAKAWANATVDLR